MEALNVNLRVIWDYTSLWEPQRIASVLFFVRENNETLLTQENDGLDQVLLEAPQRRNSPNQAKGARGKL